MKLTNKHYICEGRQRKVYIHPDEPRFCIKIPKANVHKRPIIREVKYLIKYKDKLPFISLFHGCVHTNLGKGYVFDLLCNEDGTVSRTLAEEIQSGPLDKLEDKLYFLYDTLLRNQAVVCDLHAKNIIVRRIKELEYELWIIDGVGNSDFIKICDYSKWLLRKKLLRKFSSLYRYLDLPLSSLANKCRGEDSINSL